MTQIFIYPSMLLWGLIFPALIMIIMNTYKRRKIKKKSKKGKNGKNDKKEEKGDEDSGKSYLYNADKPKIIFGYLFLGYRE